MVILVVCLAILLALGGMTGAYVLGWWMGHFRRPLLFWRSDKPIRPLPNRPHDAQEAAQATNGFVVTPEALASAESRLASQSPVFKSLSPERQAAILSRLGSQAWQLFGKGS